MRLALIIRLTIGKAYYENTFRVFHHPLIRAIHQLNLDRAQSLLNSGGRFVNLNNKISFYYVICIRNKPLKLAKSNFGILGIIGKVH